MRRERSAVRLVADANVLLSAVIGGRAALALRHNDVEQVVTPTTAYDEVFEYLAALAKKKRLDLDTLLLACAALPVTVVERSDYQQKLATARRRIGKRDPDDVDVLALALALNLPVWSNDNDFEDSGVEWHTTAELLKILGIEST
jgi:predicted nucleic acid-binding protein